MPLSLFYTMVQKSRKWPKTQIKGSCLNHIIEVLACHTCTDLSNVFFFLGGGGVRACVEAQWPIGYGVMQTSDQTVLGSNPAVAAALSPWTRLFTPIVPRRSLHISFY